MAALLTRATEGAFVTSVDATLIQLRLNHVSVNVSVLNVEALHRATLETAKKCV